MQLFVRRQRMTLVPCHPADAEELMKLPAGRDLSIKVGRVSRSLRQHRFFRALLSKVVENHPHYSSVEQLLTFLKARLGAVDEVVFHDGQVFTRLRSTSFDSMDQTEFQSFFNASLDVICTEVLPQIERKALLGEVEKMLGLKLKDIWAEEGP